MFALFLPALMGALAAAMGSFIGRAILALGVGFVTYKGIDLSIESMKQSVMSGMRGLPADAVNFAAFMYLDKALTIIFSAVVTAMAMRALGGSMKKMVMK